ncbi:MAG: hypothetical protein LBD67_05045 [Candidatus Accumulibacter sp.]|jgi:hypothetical protein|nr:hypothetical protein [Accumulibacter sp.]
MKTGRVLFAFMLHVVFFVPSAASGRAVGAPKLKPGLWAKKTVRAGQTETTEANYLVCVGKNNRDVLPLWEGHVKRACLVTEIKTEMKKTAFRYKCQYAINMTVSAEGVLEGDFNAAYTARVKEMESGPCILHGSAAPPGIHCETREFTRIYEARRTGPCAHGPGISRRPEGQKVDRDSGEISPINATRGNP